MKRCKKMLCMVLCILMVLGMFAGCNQQVPVETTEATETIETETPVFVDPIVVTEPSSLPTEAPDETIEYTITYEVDGGELPEVFQTVYSLAKPVVLPVPTKEGSLFFGWFETEDFSGDVVLTTAGQTGDKTYYAKWEISESTEPTEAEEEEKKPTQTGTGTGTGSGSQGSQQTTHVHKYTKIEEVKETCYDDGYIQYKCKCGETYKEYIVRAHKWGRWVIVREATDFEEGMRKRTCTECGVVDREKIAKQPHTHLYVATEIKATCTEDGYIRYECKCGEIYTGAEFEATGHEYEATIVAPTTEEQGYTLHKCKNCGDEYKDTYTEKLPPEETEHVHSYSSVVTDPTCTEDGYTTYTCACGDTKVYDVVEATGHDYESEVIAPTTEAQGYTLHTCKNCGDEYKDTYTEKLPAQDDPYTPPDEIVMPDGSVHTHTWGEWIPHEDGWNYRTCPGCGEMDIAW